MATLKTLMERYASDYVASFDVDAQKGFTPLCPNELPVPGGHEIVDALNKQATFATIRVGSKDAHSPEAHWVATADNGQFSPVIGHKNVDIRWNRHCEVGTTGFELLDGLPHPIDGYDFFVYKGVERDAHPYGACYHTLDWKNNKKSTGVIEYLDAQCVRVVIVGGLATDYCVKNTALQLADAGFTVILNLEACRGIAADTIEAAIAEMKGEGILIADTIE